MEKIVIKAIEMDGGVPVITYTAERNGQSEARQYPQKGTGDNPPSVQFEDALEAIVAPIVSVCGLDADAEKWGSAHLKKIEFKHTEDLTGITVTLKATFELLAHTHKSPYLTPKHVDAIALLPQKIETLLEQAQLYLEGHSSQGNLLTSSEVVSISGIGSGMRRRSPSLDATA